MASTLPQLPIFQAIASHDPRSTVIVHSASGRRFTYGELLSDVAVAKDNLLKQSGKGIEGERIAFLVENSYDYVGAQDLPFPSSYIYLEYGLPYSIGAQWLILRFYSDAIKYPGHAFNCAAPLPCLPGTRATIYTRSEPGCDAIEQQEV